MSSEKKQKEKARLHPRNRNRERYDLKALAFAIPDLKRYVKLNKYGDHSVDFSNPIAVKLLNKSLLHHYYGIENWEFPDENLCPPIPGRADYLHHIADLLSESNQDEIPKGKKITCLDIGIGASCIYPIIGVTEYGWNFIGSDIDPKSIASAENIVHSNPTLRGKIECRLQKKPEQIFQGIIGREEKIDVTICNPPFHFSIEDAQKETLRKVKNLTRGKFKKEEVLFAGNKNELIYEGGEFEFIKNMINQSKEYAKNCSWFTTLVSKESNLKGIYKLIKGANVAEIKTIPMGTGNKISRIIAWTFLTKEDEEKWREAK